MNKLHIEVQPAAAALERFGKSLQAVINLDGKWMRPPPAAVIKRLTAITGR